MMIIATLVSVHRAKSRARSFTAILLPAHFGRRFDRRCDHRDV